MKEFIKKHKTKFIVFVCILFGGIIGVSADTIAIIFSSEEVSFDNTTQGASGMSSTNVQAAIEELYDKEKKYSNITFVDTTFIPQYYEYHTGSNVTIGDAADTTSWTTNPFTLNRSYYLGHDIENGVVTANYACFILNNTQYCMKASSDGSTFATNKSLLGTLRDATPPIVTCSSFSGSPAICSGGGVGYLGAYSIGSADAGVSTSVGCGANYSGRSRCDE